MPYTILSGDTLLGETELEFPPAQPDTLSGTFRPTAAGNAILPAFLESMAAVLGIGAMLQREGLTRERRGDDLGRAIREALLRTPEGQRVAAAQAAIEALRLELRDPSGAVVRTRQIVLSDAMRSAVAFGGLPAEAPAEAEAAGLAPYVVSVLL